MKKYGIVLIILLGCIFLLLLDYYGFIPKKTYTGEYFGIKTIISNIDYDMDGIDDYTDILNGAKEYIAMKPVYKSEYYSGGYPPNGIGVCTDVIWYALKNAGYLLKDLMSEDIKNHKEDYAIDVIDSNIDFRRVNNIAVYLRKYTINLTTNPYEIEEWQPGDIVVFKKHIAIISDKRNKKGIPYIIHQGGLHYEEDALPRYEIVGHYRWNFG